MGKMNKKLLRGITAMTLSMALALTLSGTAIAAVTNEGDGTNAIIKESGADYDSTVTTSTSNVIDDEKAVTVRANVQTKYTVKVPKAITAKTTAAGSTDFTYGVYDYDLASGQSLVISLPNTVVLKSLNGTGAGKHTLNVYETSSSQDDKILVAAKQIDEDRNVGDSITETGKVVTPHDIGAGRWAATLDFKVIVSKEL